MAPPQRYLLHRARLDSGLVTGSVIAGLAATLPVTGVQLLLGNDLAGDQVVTDPDPVMTKSPIDSNHDTALEAKARIPFARYRMRHTTYDIG